MSIEEHEEIPWSMLVEQDRRGRRRTLYLAAAAIVALVVGFTGVRWFEGHRNGESAPEPASTVTSAVADTSTTTTTLLSEADLMAAVDPSAATLAAVTRAEWFVTDYFTIDGSPAPDLQAAFLTDAVLPELPQSTGDGSVSFVEWARAYDIRQHEGGFVVTVLFRTLFEGADGIYRRSPLRAVDVIVLVRDEMTAIGDLPIPVTAPVDHGLRGWMSGPGEAPPAAVAAALEYAQQFTQEPTLIESAGSGEEWRVVFAIDDPSGARFPVVLRSDVAP
ncbi:MAG: hypothetical protein BMS9Abin07_0375 [Acidimicrobiia bacterium]|nr:MAG: hypothetical protein BMS9Abin07_0375 [Acidimicrobiia bacterium]